MSSTPLPPRDDRARSGFSVALLISFLSHLLLLMLLVPWLRQPDAEPEPPMEIALVSPDEPQPEPKPEPEPEPEPAQPQPQPKPAQPSPKAAIRPAPLAAEATQEPAGLPTMDLALEAPPTAPEPEPPLPEKLDLALDWNRFEETFGDVAVREREEYHALSQERRRGGLAFGTLPASVPTARAPTSSWGAARVQEPRGHGPHTITP